MKDNPSVEQDKEFMSRINGGDKGAFDAVFHKYYKTLCAYAHRFVAMDDAEETVQDLFLWLWQNRETLIIRTTLSSYLFRAVYLRCLSRIEQNSAKQRAEKLYWQRQTDNIPQDDADFQVDELLRRIHEAIERLPESYREAFVLHRFNDCSYKEIAAQLNVSPKTVDYRIQQALKLLRGDLKDYFPLLLFLYNM